jgi:hypothetical protein
MEIGPLVQELKEISLAAHGDGRKLFPFLKKGNWD